MKTIVSFLFSLVLAISALASPITGDSLFLESNDPFLTMFNDASSANERAWKWSILGSYIHFVAATDDMTGLQLVMSFHRTSGHPDNSIFWTPCEFELPVTLKNTLTATNATFSGDVALNGYTTATAAQIGGAQIDQLLVGPGYNGNTIKLVKTLLYTYDFGLVGPGSYDSITLNFTNAGVSDNVLVGLGGGSIENTLIYSASVQSTNVVKLRVNNVGTSVVNPASQTYRITLIKFQ